MPEESTAESRHEIFISSESDEWATPPEFVRPLAQAVGGFDLDPASGAEQSPIAKETISEQEDGLRSPWFGTVWCNPPYSEMAEWTDKVISESQRTDTIVYLCKGDSSTDWWQNAADEATAIGMIDGRVAFGMKDAPFPSHVFVFGDAPTAVLDVLDRHGVVFTPGQKHETSRQVKLA